MPLLLLVLLAAPPQPDDELVLRPVIGVSASLSDSGFAVGAQLGLRVERVMLRLTAEIGGSNQRGYLLTAARASWVFRNGIFVGAGIGSLNYGWIFDDPADQRIVALPEAGYIFRSDAFLGRILFGVSGVVLLRPASSEPIQPPHVMATMTLSL